MLLPLPWVCQMTPPSRLPNALLRRLHARKLMRARHLLATVVEDDEVSDQVEQAGLLAHLRERPVKQRASGQRAVVRPPSIPRRTLLWCVTVP